MIRHFDEKILNYIKDKGLITEETFKKSLEILQTSNQDIQSFLIQERILSPQELIKIMSEILKWEVLKVENPQPDPEAVKVIPRFLTKFYKFIPLKIENKTLHIGFTIPIRPAAIDDISLITGYSVIPYILDTSCNLSLSEENPESLEVIEENDNKEAIIEIKEEEVESLEKVIEEIQKEEEKKEEKDRSRLIAEKIVGAVKDKLPTGETSLKTERTVRVPRRKLLGKILVEEGIITKEQLEKALEESNKRGKPLGEILLELKIINDYQLAQALSIQLGFPFKSLREVNIDPNVAKMINFSKARQDLVLPIYKENNKIVVAMVDPANIMALDDIKMITKSEIEPVVVPKSEFLEVISRLWATQETEKLIEDLIRVEEEEPQVQEVSLEEISEEGPTAKLVNSLLLDAVTQGASDIHIEPMEKSVRIRFRIDGILHEIANFPKRLQAPIVSRIKIISDMDIAERRVPQDGRIKMLIRGSTYDFRVSTLPGIFGEKVVLRILGRSEISLSLESLGFSDENYKRYLKMLKSPYGIILVTGPTGSGKSTTLYASLNMINSPDINIVTVEDPVEYQLPGIHQVQVNPKAGLTFANALRAILRQDPDVVLVGEIRDEETARIAIQAALTGHLVLSTLHTNDAPSAVTRLIDMGIEPFLISSSLLGVVAQRLVRKICPRCKEAYEPTPEDLEVLKTNLPSQFDPKNLTLYKGKGCGYCNNKGYRGRTAIHEVMLIDDEIRELILKKVSKDTIRETARKKGMNTLREDGLLKVLKGITTIEEVMRVTAAD